MFWSLLLLVRIPSSLLKRADDFRWIHTDPDPVFGGEEPSWNGVLLQTLHLCNCIMCLRAFWGRGAEDYPFYSMRAWMLWKRHFVVAIMQGRYCMFWPSQSRLSVFLRHWIRLAWCSWLIVFREWRLRNSILMIQILTVLVGISIAWFPGLVIHWVRFMAPGCPFGLGRCWYTE